MPGEVTADWYGQVKSGLAKGVTPIPQNDIWIAATALEHNLPLVTRDAHFSRVPDLAVLNWSLWRIRTAVRPRPLILTQA